MAAVAGDGAHSVAEDHLKLARMVTALKAVITHGGQPPLVVEALSVLRDRLKLHFQIEERAAANAAADLRARLRAGHAELTAGLDRMISAAAAGALPAVRTDFENFLAACERHENEVDAPLFGRHPG